MASDLEGLMLAGLRVLLIDDEELVRLTVADTLESCGALVSESGTASQAFEALNSGTHFDVAVCDLSIPGRNSKTLSEVIAAEHPALPILVISGSGVDDSDSEGFNYLGKPFRPDQLVSAVLATVNDDADSSN